MSPFDKNREVAAARRAAAEEMRERAAAAVMRAARDGKDAWQCYDVVRALPIEEERG